MSAAATIPTTIAPWTVHPEHIRAAFNIAGQGIGVTRDGTIVIGDETHIRSLGGEVLAYPWNFDAIVAERGIAGAAELYTRGAEVFRTSRG